MVAGGLLMELADMQDSKSCPRKGVRVRVPEGPFLGGSYVFRC